MFLTKSDFTQLPPKLPQLDTLDHGLGPGPGWGPYGPIWALMGPYMGPYGPIWAHVGPYGPMWALMGPPGQVLGFRKLSVNFP